MLCCQLISLICRRGSAQKAPISDMFAVSQRDPEESE